MMSEQTIRVGVACADKWHAITAAGELLAAAGHVDAGYTAFMLARERVATTYVGNGVAMPHATREGMALVRTPGIAVLQIPGGVDFGDGQVSRLVFGLAARDGAHLELLTHLATICADDARLETLVRAPSAGELLAALAPDGPASARAFSGNAMRSRTLVVRHPHGLHARPVGQFVQVARAHAGAVRIQKDGKVVDGKSVLTILTLGVKCDDTITLEVEGADAAVLDRLGGILAAPPEPPLRAK